MPENPSPTTASTQPSTWRAIKRAVGLVLHVLRGLATIMLRFPHFTQMQRQTAVQHWASGVLQHCGIRLQIHGTPALPTADCGMLRVANHISWLDIVALHATGFCRFVSKDEVRRWFVLGTLATRAGTLYIQRGKRRDTVRILQTIAQALRAGDIITIFPEGTTSNGLDVLPFHSNLLQAPIDAPAHVQPIALRFVDSHNQPSAAISYIDDDTLLDSIWRVLCDNGITVHVHYGETQSANGRNRQQWGSDLQAAVQKLLHDAQKCS